MRVIFQLIVFYNRLTYKLQNDSLPLRPKTS